MLVSSSIARNIREARKGIGLAPLHSSKRMDWQTPDVVLELVRKVGPIGLDPCTTQENPTGARQWFAPPDNGLSVSWGALIGDGEVAFVNPPYGRALGEWVTHWCFDASIWADQEHSILLVPARPDTAWWFRALKAATALCFWRGRLTFKGAPAPAPFPSALFYFGPRPYRFADVFQDHGAVDVLRRPT